MSYTREGVAEDQRLFEWYESCEECHVRPAEPSHLMSRLSHIKIEDQKGFSLIELLIVVVIIGIIAAIAIPNLLASRRAANEGSAVSSLRTIHGAQMTYAATLGQGDYAGDMSGGNGMPVLASSNLLDPSLGSGLKSGYVFATYSTPRDNSNLPSFVAGATPSSIGGYGATGLRTFLVATAGVIYSDDAATGTMDWTRTAPITITGGTPLNN